LNLDRCQKISAQKRRSTTYELVGKRLLRVYAVLRGALTERPSQRPAKIVSRALSRSGAVKYQSRQLATQLAICLAHELPNRGGKASLPVGAAGSMRGGARIAPGSSAPFSGRCVYRKPHPY
jgi:hypothetical protein